MAQASAVKTRSGFFGGSLGEVLAGVLGVLLAGSLFFAFFVQPRAQQERDRIYRAMAQVARLIDDQVEVADLALAIGRGYEGREGDVLEDYPHLKVGCPNDPVLCVASLPEPNGEHTNRGPIGFGAVHLPLKTIAENADLPYPEAILLIMDENGNVLAGQDLDGRWSLFHSLGNLILGADGPGGKALEPGSKPAGSSGGEASTTRELAQMKQTIEAYQRGERNAVFSGAPARLTHSFGGQDYAVFMAAHRLSAAEGAVWIGGDDSPIVPGAQGAEQGEAGPTQSRSLIYAYLVPERVIDSTATALPKNALVHMLMVIVVLFLAIPLIKLFSQNALKPIRRTDLAGVMLSIMLITMTATLFTTVVLFRSSVTRDIEGELAWLSGRVSQSLSNTIDAAHKGGTATKDVLFGTHQGVVAQQDAQALVGVTAVDTEGDCLSSLDEGQEGLCAGRFYGAQPEVGNLNVAQRAYFKALQMGVGFPTGNYVQFLRSKGNGRLSLSAMGDEVSCSGENCGEGNKDGTQLFTLFPVALRAPVLPPNFGFMVVLNSDLPEELGARGSRVVGDVLYHSHQARSMNENLLVEAEYDPRLASALEMLRRGTLRSVGTSEPVRSSLLPISYQGRPHFALVRPVPDTPWSVVAIYARDEALDLLGFSVVQAFLLGCVWVVFVFVACWALPRLLRASVLRPEPGATSSEARQKEIPIRGRSIWFVPNALMRTRSGDGLCYSFVTSGPELIWQGGVLLLQGAVLWACAPEVAVLASCVLALVILFCNYLTIIGRSEAAAGERGRQFTERVAKLRKGVAGLTLVIMALVLFRYWKIDDYSHAQVPLFLLAAAVVVAIQAARWKNLGHNRADRARTGSTQQGGACRCQAGSQSQDLAGPESLDLTPQECAHQRQAYILRTLTLLTIVVSMPMVCIMALTYSVNVERYMGRALAHVAAQSELQARTFQKDAVQLERILKEGAEKKDSAGYGARSPASKPLKVILEQWNGAFKLDSHTPENSGWLVSQLPGAKTGDFTSGGDLFGIDLKTDCENNSGNRCSFSPRSQGWLAALVERLQPRIGVSDPAVQDQTARYVLSPQAGRLVLTMPGQFQPIRAGRAGRPGAERAQALEASVGPPDQSAGASGWSLEGQALVSGDSTQLPLHPDWLTKIFLGVFVALFGFAMYRLLVAVAEHLTGLYLLPVQVSPEQLKARREQMQSHPRMAWDALGGYPQKARLLALAYGRTINFHERASIRDLVERGYLQLTPYVRIASEELAEFIRHDLPREERARVREYCVQVDDKWDHVRLPIIVAYVAACMLVAYVSPNLVQLVTTSFFALAALLPLMRDPLAQFLGKRG